jgi:hypothetical protein
LTHRLERQPGSCERTLSSSSSCSRYPETERVSAADRLWDGEITRLRSAHGDVISIAVPVVVLARGTPYTGVEGPFVAATR